MIRLRYLRTIIILLITILASGCTDYRHTKVPSHIKESYNEFMKTADTLFTSHFPSKLDYAKSVEFSQQLTGGYSSYPMIYLEMEPPIEDFREIYEKYNKSDIHRYWASDTSVLIINNWRSLKDSKFSVKRDKEFNKKMSRLNKSTHAIPNFYKLGLDNSERNPTMLSKDYEIFVVDSQQGIYWDLNELADNAYIPKDWKHGFSKGIAFNEHQSKLIYWVVIW